MPVNNNLVFNMTNHLIVNMKLRILTIIILLLTGIVAFGQRPKNRHLPKPTHAQIIDEYTKDKAQIYLESNFRKVGTKLILEKFKVCTENCVCSWEQQFEKGIKYKYYDCHEAGFNVRITFQGYDIKEISKLVDTLFKTDENVWNDEMTSYKPKDNGAGCYYEIRQENGVVILEYDCGC